MAGITLHVLHTICTSNSAVPTSVCCGVCIVCSPPADQPLQPQLAAISAAAACMGCTQEADGEHSTTVFSGAAQQAHQSDGLIVISPAQLSACNQPGQKSVLHGHCQCHMTALLGQHSWRTCAPRTAISALTSHVAKDCVHEAEWRHNLRHARVFALIGAHACVCRCRSLLRPWTSVSMRARATPSCRRSTPSAGSLRWPTTLWRLTPRGPGQSLMRLPPSKEEPAGLSPGN